MPIQLPITKGISWGETIYFFDEFDFFIRAKLNSFDVISYSLNTSLRISFKNAKHFTLNKRTNAIYFITPVIINRCPSTNHSLMYKMNPFTLTIHECLALPIEYEYLNLILTENSESIILIHACGKVIEIDLESYNIIKTLDLSIFSLDECYTHDGRFWLYNLLFGWQYIDDNTYSIYYHPSVDKMYKITFQLKDNYAYSIQVDFKSIMNTDSHFVGAFYSKKFNLWSFIHYADSPTITSNINMDFREETRYLYLSIIKNQVLSSQLTMYFNSKRQLIFKEMSDTQYIITSVRDNVIYLVDIENHNVLALKLKEKEIMDIFVDRERKLILPLFFYGSSKICYSMDDFE